jgi:hypothetical protein
VAWALHVIVLPAADGDGTLGVSAVTAGDEAPDSYAPMSIAARIGRGLLSASTWMLIP